MTRTPTISVLMPAWNPGPFGVEAVHTVLEALGPCDELVIQDNLSDDGWLDALPADARIHLESARDRGQADALNRALARSSGELVIWTNADDVMDADGLVALRSAASEQATEVVFGNFATVDVDGATYRVFRPGQVTLRRLVLGGCVVFNGSMLIPRETLVTVGGFDETFNYAMDYELFLRLWSEPSAKPVYVDARVGSLRLHGVTKTSSHPWRFVGEARRARRKVVRRYWLSGLIQTACHSLTVATRGVRESAFYRRARHGYVRGTESSGVE